MIYVDRLRETLNRTRKESAEAIHAAELNLDNALDVLRVALMAPEERNIKSSDAIR